MGFGEGKMAHRFLLNRIKPFLYLAVPVILFLSTIASGYVMPADQILDFMCNNFKATRTVSIIHSTLQTLGGNERVFTEQIWVEAPDRFSVKALDRMGNRDIISPDIMYRQLFVINSRERIERLLLSLGVDTLKTSLTRVDGAIAMRIGGKEASSPKIIIEKERFLPLLISYRLPGDDELITVIFRDYQKKGIGWQPYEIIYKKGESLTEKYTVQSLNENIPVDAIKLQSLPEYQVPVMPETQTEVSVPAPEGSGEDPEHLQDVLKTYEEQYR